MKKEINYKYKTFLIKDQEIKDYFKRKCNLDMTEDDYQETAQSLYYLGKAIYRSLELGNKQKVYNSNR